MTNTKSLSLRLGFIGAALLLVPSYAAGQTENVNPGVKLILQITVDQLRGDLPERYLKNMGEGGFRYLLKDGIWYADANYTQANTETVVGHTSLAPAPIHQSTGWWRMFGWIETVAN